MGSPFTESTSDRICLLDPASGQEWSYLELDRDSALPAPESCAVSFDHWYDYLVKLVGAIRRSAAIALLPPGLHLPVIPPPPEQPLRTQTPPASVTPLLPLDGELFTRTGCRIGMATSGTTGQPKLVWHEMETLARGVRQGEKHSTDIWGLAYHPTHFAGLQVILQALANRNPLVALFGLATHRIDAAIESTQLTHLSATPTFYRLLCTPQAPPHPLVRRLTVGGERTPASLLEHLRRIFPNARLTNLYASTEAGTLLASKGEAFRIPASLKDRVRVRNDELEVHHSLLALSLRAAEISTPITGDGFVPTGDRVEWLEENESFKIVGRAHEQLNVGGYKVNATEVEDAVLNVPGIAAARIYGRANSITGTLLCCDVVVRSGESLSTRILQAKLAEVLPAYKVPGLINFVDSISLTYSGKQAQQG